MRIQLIDWPIILLLIFTGCSPIPFKKTARFSFEQEDALTVRNRFEQKIPDSFQVMNNIVFNWKKNLMAIGYTEINNKEKTFQAVCLNPMGIKLFEITGDERQTTSLFMLEEFNKNGADFAKIVGEDIKRVYFDLIPPTPSTIKREKYRIIFNQGNLEYIFAGVGGYLAEKNCYENDELLWQVGYYEYQEHKGRLFPGGIILKNHKYGYELIIKLKEIYQNESYQERNQAKHVGLANN